MKPDKEIKKEFKKQASEDPAKYYPVKILKEAGFSRKQCRCGTWFWSKQISQEKCGDSSCSGGFRFFDDNPCREKLSYTDVWKSFSLMFKELGYTPIKRYPVVARWRDDMEFVIASIADFQPYVVSGEVEPPANPLVVPQFCLRFGDVDNVGVTGSHMTCFNMIGQHMFVKPEEWDQEKVFRDIKKWLNEGLGLDDSEITFHEDAWAGGGNFGPCMEFFSRGVEIGNQVYMLYEQTEKGAQELKLKVLDMGMGMERCAWFSQATPTIYDAVFPSVIKKLKEKTGIKTNDDVLKRFVPYAGLLNMDEVEDIDEAWKTVAEKTGADVESLKRDVLPIAGLYSVAEHARGLLIALSDGALPSNTGGGYNLRMLARRAFSFIDRNRWDINLADVAVWHAEELRDVFPELSDNIAGVRKIIDVEKEKYESSRKKSESIVKNIIRDEITEEKLLELYDSNGISPETVREEAARLGRNIDIPSDFFMKVSARHEKSEQQHATKKEAKADFGEWKPVQTEQLYLNDSLMLEFTAKVLKVSGNHVVLDRTAFYPTSGGQLHDTGTVSGKNVVDVFKQGNVIVHEVDDASGIDEGSEVSGKIDYEPRIQLSQHHTSAHIVNAAARKVLGKHVNQAGAKKTLEKAHLDITHYQSIGEHELKAIEKEANAIVDAKIPIETFVLPRAEAEKKYGMAIYQGGAVPGKQIRIVEIKGVDVEACGGTHLRNTSEAGKIKMQKSTKISDSIVRITFTAGAASEKGEKDAGGMLGESAEILGVKPSQVPARAEELFSKWKSAKKKIKKGIIPEESDFELVSSEEYGGDALAKAADILKTQPEHVPKALLRFLAELDSIRKSFL